MEGLVNNRLRVDAFWGYKKVLPAFRRKAGRQRRKKNAWGFVFLDGRLAFLFNNIQRNNDEKYQGHD
jgi:hypothetical protein